MRTKTIVVVDADVDVQNLAAVEAHIMQTVDWQRDLVRIEGTLEDKIGVNATRKNAVDNPQRVLSEALGVPPEIVDKIFRILGACRAADETFRDSHGYPFLKGALDMAGGCGEVDHDFDYPEICGQMTIVQTRQKTPHRVRPIFQCRDNPFCLPRQTMYPSLYRHRKTNSFPPETHVGKQKFFCDIYHIKFRIVNVDSNQYFMIWQSETSN